MKEIVLLIILVISFLGEISAQYKKAHKEAMRLERKGDYYNAILYYNSANVCDDKPKKNDIEKRIKICAKELNLLRTKAQLANKKTNDILKALLPKNVTMIYKYFMGKGDDCIILGNFEEAKKQYKLALNSPDLPNKNTIYKRYVDSEKCNIWQKNALKFLYDKEYDLAEQEILKVLKVFPTSRNSIIIASAINPEYSLVNVKGGSFNNGSNDCRNSQPIHKVYIDSFRIGKYEVTNLQFCVFLNKYNSNKILTGKYEDEVMIYTNHRLIFYDTEVNKYVITKGFEYYPVSFVTWYGAYEFCKFYNLQIPTEAQWEYAAKGISNSNDFDFKFSGSNIIDSVSWYEKTSNGKNNHPVGLLKKNQIGVFDMSGNVWEWCLDWYSKTYYFELSKNKEIKNPVNNKRSEKRVKRGGSGMYNADASRVTCRHRETPNIGNADIGFRYVK